MAKLGLLEYEITFTDRETGEAFRTISTPSMWALADEWADKLRATGGHTPAWVGAKQGQAIWLQAAQDEGLVEGGTIDLAGICEMLNRYAVSVKSRDEDAPDPTEAAQGGGPAAE